MPLNLETVNLISDGQAVTADNLNAPSVSLRGRTSSIKSSYDVAETERVILRGYSTTLRGGTRPTLTVTAGEVTPEGDKFYSLSLSTGASLRYSSPLSNMGRIELTQAQLSSYSNNEGNNWSKHLVRVGDTLALEMSAHEDLSSAPDASLVGAAQEDSSNLDNAFTAVSGDVQLIKLPYRRMGQLKSDDSASDIITAVNNDLTSLGSSGSFSLSLSGVLDTSSSDSASLEVSVDGGTLYGTVYSITSGIGGLLYVTTTSPTSFLDYDYSLNVDVRFRVSWKGSVSNPHIPANQSDRKVLPGSVDLDKIYIPVATLEEDGVRIHGVGTCSLPAVSGGVEVIGPNGRSTKTYLPGESYTVETVLSRESDYVAATTSVVSIPVALAEQIQDYGGHVLLKTFSITTLSSFDSASGGRPTFTATARLDFNNGTVESTLASGVHMPSTTNNLETSMNALADAKGTIGATSYQYVPSVWVTVSALQPDSDAKALLRLSFSYVPA